MVASGSVIVEDMTEHEHATGQKRLRMRLSEEASGIERGLICIDAWSLPRALLAVSAQIMRRILSDSARKRADSVGAGPQRAQQAGPGGSTRNAPGGLCRAPKEPRAARDPGNRMV